MAKRLLIVEDDPEIRALERMLAEEELGLIVDEAETGRDGVESAHRNRPDLVILDLRLPDGDGVWVLKSMREDRQLSNVPVMVVTAMSGPANRNRVLAAGATDIMFKPFDAHAYIVHIAALLSDTGPGFAEPSPG